MFTCTQYAPELEQSVLHAPNRSSADVQLLGLVLGSSVGGGNDAQWRYIDLIKSQMH